MIDEDGCHVNQRVHSCEYGTSEGAGRRAVFAALREEPALRRRRLVHSGGVLRAAGHLRYGGKRADHRCGDAPAQDASAAPRADRQSGLLRHSALPDDDATDSHQIGDVLVAVQRLGATLSL